MYTFFNDDLKTLPLNKDFQKLRFFSTDWFLALLNGERALWEAYLIFGALVLGISILTPFVLSPFWGSLFPFISIFWLCFTLVVKTFWLVSIWKCATTLHNNLVLFVVRLGVIGSAFTFLREMFQ